MYDTTHRPTAMVTITVTKTYTINTFYSGGDAEAITEVQKVKEDCGGWGEPTTNTTTYEVFEL